MIRLPDENGKQYYMGTFSQNCSDTEGGLVFVAELVPGETDGKVIWWEELNNRHRAGGFNHPGNLRRLGHTVVIAGQNWAGTKASRFAVKNMGADPMNMGNGGEYVLFYDVSNSSTPKYMGKLNSCWKGLEVLTAANDIDDLTLSKVGKYYYLWFNGHKNIGVKCRSEILSPEANWELIEEGKDEGCSPLVFNIDGVQYSGGAKIDGKLFIVTYNKLIFMPDPFTLTGDSGSVARIRVTKTRFQPFSFGTSGSRDGTTYTLNSLSDGKCSIVITDVESHHTINIAEIECSD
jgi:WD40 repeat protein